MNKIRINTTPEVALVFNKYPPSVNKKLLALRDLIIETATETEGVTQLVETLKWGEPSYLTKSGSTIRIDWKSKSPNQYAIYFQCQSRLIETFRTLFNKVFSFEGNRAIVFQLTDKLPAEILKHCIKAALTYHKVKHMPTLGI